MEKGTIGRNKISGYSGMEQGIEGANSDLSHVRFFIEKK